MVEILNTDYTEHVDLVGTAHFTRRSIHEAYTSIKHSQPTNVALELDLRRFQTLNAACVPCPKRGLCKGLCEFTVAAKALGNVDANIWLIDMTEREMHQRINSRMTPTEQRRIGLSMYRNVEGNSLWLWEKGFKDQVINNTKREIERLRKLFPAVWRVLIDERNALMAARLAWIASPKNGDKEISKILTFVGAAHVDGVTTLLREPLLIKSTLRDLDLSFTKPALIRRMAIQGD